MSKIKIAGLYDSSIYVKVLGIFILVSIVTAAYHTPTNSAGGLPFVHILNNTYSLCFFLNNSHSDRYVKTSNCGFDLNFSDG